MQIIKSKNTNLKQIEKALSMQISELKIFYQNSFI